MSKTLKNYQHDDKKIHRVGKKRPERDIDQELKRISNIEDLEDFDFDEIHDGYNQHTQNLYGN